MDIPGLVISLDRVPERSRNLSDVGFTNIYRLSAIFVDPNTPYTIT